MGFQQAAAVTRVRKLFQRHPRSALTCNRHDPYIVDGGN